MIDNEFERHRTKYVWHEVYSDITSTSFTQTADIGEKGGKLKRWVTIQATRVTKTPPVNSDVFLASGADEIATVKALEKQAWEAWRNNDLATIKRLCAPDYVSTDGEVTVTLTGIERPISDTQIRDYSLGEMKAVRVSKNVVRQVYYYPN